MIYQYWENDDKGNVIKTTFTFTDVHICEYIYVLTDGEYAIIELANTFIKTYRDIDQRHSCRHLIKQLPCGEEVVRALVKMMTGSIVKWEGEFDQEGMAGWLNELYIKQTSVPLTDFFTERTMENLSKIPTVNPANLSTSELDNVMM
jgi:hypothetical protein